MPFSNPKASKIKVFMYEAELNYLKWLVVQKPDIETGGDLFGLWQNKHIAIVQLILGPGNDCSRTTTSFHQDVEYLGDVGRYLTSSQGLCNIGEWHSHHRIGLTEPSGGDQRTVWSHMPEIAGGRFVLFIAHIVGPKSDPKVNVRCFVFNNATGKMVVGKIECLPSYSPLRDVMNEKYLKPRSEFAQDWETSLRRNPYIETPMNRGSTPVELKGVTHYRDDEDDTLHYRDENKEAPILERKSKQMSRGSTPEKLKGVTHVRDDEDGTLHYRDENKEAPMLERRSNDEEANMSPCCTLGTGILSRFRKCRLRYVVCAISFVVIVVVGIILLLVLLP